MFFQQLRDLCLVGGMSAAHVCKHSFDTVFLELRVQARTDLRAQTQRSQGANRQLPCPLTCTKSAPTGAAGTQRCLFPELQGPLGTARWVSHLQKGHREQQWEAGVFLQANRVVTPLACSL